MACPSVLLLSCAHREGLEGARKMECCAVWEFVSWNAEHLEEKLGYLLPMDGEQHSLRHPHTQPAKVQALAETWQIL